MSKKTMEDLRNYFLELYKSYRNSSKNFVDQDNGIKYYYDGASDAYKHAAECVENNFIKVLKGHSTSPKTRKPATRRPARK